MADDAQQDSTNDGDQQQQEAGQEFKAPSSQEELDRIIGERLKRERSKFADYDSLKEKAKAFDEAEEAQKTELQKLADRAEAAEKKAAEAERASLRTRIAAELDVPVEVLHGDDEESLRASAEKVIAWRDSGKPAPPKPRSLKSGASGSSENETGKARAAAALRQLRSSD